MEIDLTLLRMVPDGLGEMWILLCDDGTLSRGCADERREWLTRAQVGDIYEFRWAEVRWPHRLAEEAARLAVRP